MRKDFFGDVMNIIDRHYSFLNDPDETDEVVRNWWNKVYDTAYRWYLMQNDPDEKFTENDFQYGKELIQSMVEYVREDKLFQNGNILSELMYLFSDDY